MQQVSRRPERLEGELKYDYCARRLLDKHRIAIIKLGRVFYNGDVPYVKPYNNRKSMSKAQKKRFKKARRAYKFSLQNEEV